MACVSSEWPCHWCARDELCTHNHSCPQQHIIYNSRVRSFILFFFTCQVLFTDLASRYSPPLPSCHFLCLHFVRYSALIPYSLGNSSIRTPQFNYPHSIRWKRPCFLLRGLVSVTDRDVLWQAGGQILFSIRPEMSPVSHDEFVSCIKSSGIRHYRMNVAPIKVWPHGAVNVEVCACGRYRGNELT